MIKTFSSLVMVGLIALSISGCSDKKPEVSVNNEVKKAPSSFKNDSAQWQQFKSKKALESLEN